MHENRKKRQSTEEDSIGIIQVVYVSVDDCSGLFDRQTLLKVLEPALNPRILKVNPFRTILLEIHTFY